MRIPSSVVSYSRLPQPSTRFSGGDRENTPAREGSSDMNPDDVAFLEVALDELRINSPVKYESI